jgi:hypothetical protein
MQLSGSWKMREKQLTWTISNSPPPIIVYLLSLINTLLYSIVVSSFIHCRDGDYVFMRYSFHIGFDIITLSFAGL